MKYTIELSSKFKKDYKSIKKRGKNTALLQEVVELLADGESLPDLYHDHPLIGNYLGYRECHIQPDWLLIYRICEDRLILGLMRTGTHSDSFSK